MFNWFYDRGITLSFASHDGPGQKVRLYRNEFSVYVKAASMGSLLELLNDKKEQLCAQLIQARL